MTVWCRLFWRARSLNIGLLPISEDRATLGSDSSAVWGFAGGDAFGCRSFLMPGFSHVSVVFQPWEQGWPHYILCLIMGLTSEYVGTLGHDTPAISGQFRSAATTGCSSYAVRITFPYFSAVSIASLIRVLLLAYPTHFPLLHP